MSREQIEEMAKDLCPLYEEYKGCNNCDAVLNIGDEPCVYKCMAEMIIDKGYRKQSEGEWIKDEKSKFEHRYYCSACNFYLIGAPTNYCEECGAKMKGGAE